MKKRKFNLLLEIATLCLCVAAIAFGVYSAKTASLNVTGTIGFNAHNCLVDVTAKLTGDGVITNSDGTKTTSPNGNVRREPSNLTATFDANAGKIEFGSLYFADMDTINGKAAPIKIIFTIVNNSAFDIKADVTIPTNSEMSIIADKESVKIEKDKTKNIATITITFTLNNPEADLKIPLDLSGIKFDFTKFEFKKSDIELNKVDKTNGDDIDKNIPANYYITYGKNNNVAQQWYLIGKYESDELVALTDSDITTDTSSGETKYSMKDEITYAFLSKYILSTSDNSGEFLSERIYYNVSYNINDNIWHNLEYEVPADDYASSNLRKYLIGITVNNTSVEDADNKIMTPNKENPVYMNFFTDNTELKNNDIYTLIKTRTLENLYLNNEKMEINNYDSEVQNGDIEDVVNKSEGISKTDSDAFWALSFKEVRDLLTTSRSDQSGSNSYTLSKENNEYWLRSSYVKKTPNPEVCCVNGSWGTMQTEVGCGANSGVRPAFII